jgi:cell division protein FtsA
MESILQNPIYATSIGLVDHGYKQMNDGLIAEQGQSWLTKLLKIVKSEY